MFLFVFCYLGGHLSNRWSSFSKKQKGGGVKVLPWASVCFCFFFAEMECLSSFLARENHWPSLFFFSSVFRLRRAVRGATAPRSRSSEFSLHSFQVVHASLYYYYFFFFFSNKRPWSLSRLMSLIFLCETNVSKNESDGLYVPSGVARCPQGRQEYLAVGTLPHLTALVPP